MRKTLLTLIMIASVAFAADAQIITSFERPSAKEFKAAVKSVLQSTSCTDADRAPRIEAMNVIQREINNFGSEAWHDFTHCWDWVKIADLELNGTLYFYRQAFNKVRNEIKSTKVADGTVVLWNLYNMGYIVKTPTQTFGIDIVHKHIEEIAADLEFVLVTHKHGDHHTAHEGNQLALGESKVVAGYKLNKPLVWQSKVLDWNYVEDGDRIKIGDVTINCNRVDHNRQEWGHRLVTTYEIDCGNRSGNIILFHTGDAHNYEQLFTEMPCDIFIFHTAVGLKIQKAIDKIKPQYAIFSHAWELGHSAVKWRWTIDDLLKISGKIENFDQQRILLPTWGDKIVYTKATKTVSAK